MKIFGREPLRWRGNWGSIVDLRDINNGMASQSEGKFCGSRGDALNVGHEQGADVQQYGEGCQPGEATVLRAIVGQNGIRDMALQKLRGPVFPTLQKLYQIVRLMIAHVAAQKL